MRTNKTVLLAVLLLAAGCGGGGQVPDIVPEPTTVDLPADATVSGSVVIGLFFRVGDVVIVGDSVGDVVSVGLYRFDLSSLPAGAVVTEAQLTTGVDLMVGTPFAQLGDLLVAHVDIGPDLDLTDGDSPALEAVTGVLATDGTLEEKTVDVTAAVQADLQAGRTTSDYRVHFDFAPDGESDDDYVNLTNVAYPGTVGVEPVLTVTYVAP